MNRVHPTAGQEVGFAGPAPRLQCPSLALVGAALPGRIDPLVDRLVRSRAGQLAGYAGILRSEREDFQQQIYLVLVKRLYRVDGHCGQPMPVVATVIRRTAANIFRSCRAEKRDRRRCDISLSTMTGDGEGGQAELCQMIPAGQQPRRAAERARSDQELFELAEDVRTIIAQLPPEMRRMCELLKEMSVRQAAQEMGMPRSRLSEMIVTLRAQFEEAGLREYF